jgi:hypothetical protein
MSIKNALVCLVGLGALAVYAQAPPATPPAITPPVTPARMQAAARPSPDVVAGIPVNYDESKVGTYMLPEALKLAEWQAGARTRRTWNEKRRPEIVKIFETQQYGVLRREGRRMRALR